MTVAPLKSASQGQMVSTSRIRRGVQARTLATIRQSQPARSASRIGACTAPSARRALAEAGEALRDASVTQLGGRE